MNDADVTALLSRTGKALSPDPARLQALLVPEVRPVPSPLSVSVYVRTAVGALAIVLIVGGAVWSTTPTVTPLDDYALFSATLEDDLLEEAATVALLDQGIDAAFTEADVFTDEFLDSVLYL